MLKAVTALAATGFVLALVCTADAKMGDRQNAYQPKADNAKKGCPSWTSRSRANERRAEPIPAGCRQMNRGS